MTDISSSQSSINSSQDQASSQAKFVIPKKSKTQHCSLTDLDNDIETNIIEQTLTKSNFDQSNQLIPYERSETKRIENKTLEDEFSKLLNAKKSQLNEKNKLFINAKNTKNKLIERSLFYVVHNKDDLMDIVKNGFTCKSSDEDDLNVLGPAKYGFHMSKHLDLTLLYQYSLKIKSFYVLIVKTFYSHFRLSVPIPESNKDSYPDPNDGVEMSNQLPDNKQPIRARYHNSLVYLFDADQDSNLLEKPKNMLPWVVLKFEQSQTLMLEKKFFDLYINPNLNDLKSQIRLRKEQKFLEQKKQIKQKQKPKQTPQLQPFKTTQPVPVQTTHTLKPFQTKPIQPTIRPTKPPELPPLLPQPPINLNLQFEPTLPPALLPNPYPPPEPDIPSQPAEIVPVEILSVEPIEDVPAQTTQIVPVLPKPFVINDPRKPKKLPRFIGSESSESESDADGDSDDEDWAEICYNYYMENYSNFIEELHVKPPRWRVIYERTGRLDVKFKSARQLEVKLDDIRKTKLKFLNEEKTMVNLKDPTNNLILTYHLKRMKNSTSSTSLVKPDPKTKQEPIAPSTSQDPKKISLSTSLFSKKLAELKKKNQTDSDTKNIKKEKVEIPTTSADKKPKPTGLSSEMTSLEKRLLAKSTSTLNKEIPKKNDKIEEPKKRGFWEPDTDSEFYLTRIRREKCEPFDDVLILTRVNLTKKMTIEYSKPYYDSNISLLEAEVEKFKRLNSGIIPTDDNLVKPKIESHVKVPLKPSTEPQTRREKFMNKTKYVHHVKTNNLLTEFQVDNLNKFPSLKQRVELHAGGFNGLVLDTGKRKNCRTFDPIAEVSEENQAAKKISLNDYRSTKPVKIEPVEIHVKIEPLTQPENDPLPMDTGLSIPVAAPIPVTTSNSLIEIKTEPIALPTLSLIDEVKKRVAQDSSNKSPIEDVVIKKRVKNKKKFKNKKKKIKKILNSSSSSSSSDDSESGSDESVKHKKIKVEQEDGELDDESSEEFDEVRHRSKHKHKHRHKKKSRTDESDQNPNYEFDFMIEDSFVEPDIKTELSHVPSPYIVRTPPEPEQNDYQIDHNLGIQVSESLGLPLDPVPRPPPPPPPPPPPTTLSQAPTLTETTPVKSFILQNVHSADPVSRFHEIMRLGSTMSTNPSPSFNTPTNTSRYNKFHTPTNQGQKLKPQNFSSTPGFRFSKAPDNFNGQNFNNKGFKLGQNYTSPMMGPMNQAPSLIQNQMPVQNGNGYFNRFNNGTMNQQTSSFKMGQSYTGPPMMNQMQNNFNRFNNPTSSSMQTNGRYNNIKNNNQRGFMNNTVPRFNPVSRSNHQNHDEGEDGEIIDY